VGREPEHGGPLKRISALKLQLRRRWWLSRLIIGSKGANDTFDFILKSPVVVSPPRKIRCDALANGEQRDLRLGRAATLRVLAGMVEEALR
jgi:hypothetical protein